MSATVFTTHICHVSLFFRLTGFAPALPCSFVVTLCFQVAVRMGLPWVGQCSVRSGPSVHGRLVRPPWPVGRLLMSFSALRPYALSSLCSPWRPRGFFRLVDTQAHVVTPCPRFGTAVCHMRGEWFHWSRWSTGTSLSLSCLCYLLLVPDATLTPMRVFVEWPVRLAAGRFVDFRGV